MKIYFSTKSLKFLDKLSDKEKEKLRVKIKELLLEIESTGIIPFSKLSIKKLEVNWKGFFRMRSGKIRIIFNIDRNAQVINIYEIDFRGNVYR